MIPYNYVRELNPVEPKSHAFVKNRPDQNEVSWYTLGLKSNISVHIYVRVYLMVLIGPSTGCISIMT